MSNDIHAEQHSDAPKLFRKGGKLDKLYPLWEAGDTFLKTPGIVTKKAPHVRDAVDLKRVMIFVVIALLPCLCMGIYNVGYQILLAQNLPVDFGKTMMLGASKVLPIIIVTYAAGGFWEALFAIIRRHEINEGFLVTGILFALTLPPTIPLWQAAVGISFGVVFGKEIFGGTGMNVFNPALVARAFVFFAYPAQMAGSAVWVALDGYTRATPLGVLKDTSAARGTNPVELLAQNGYDFHNMFTGLIPGSIGETSTIACIMGLVFLLVTGVASWRVMAGCAMGLLGMATVFFLTSGPSQPAIFALPPYWHLAIGGFAFGAVFMATDPVSSAATNAGRWIYGILIGALVCLIRLVNPAYPEGVMLSILFMNIFAPLIDHFVIESKIAKRMKKFKASAVSAKA